MSMAPSDYRAVLEFTGMDFGYVEAMWTPLRYADHKGDLHLITDGRIKTLDDLENVIMPDYSMDVAPRLEAFRAYKKEFEGTGIGISVALGAPFQCCYYFLCGFENFLTALYTDVEYAEKMLDICFDYYTMMLEIFLEEGMDILIAGDDIAYKQGLFVKPEIMEEIWLPRYQKFIGLAKSAGLPVLFHCCGKVGNIFDNIILKLGVDAIDPIEPYSNDIYDVKERYGDQITISGNIDIAGPLAFGTPDEARADVVRHLERLMPGGRYICGSSHSITNDIPFENYCAMLDAINTVGIY